jgi:hypothetical protein
VEAIVDDRRDNFYGLLRHHYGIIENLEREKRALEADLKEAYEAANRETARPKQFWKNWQKVVKDGPDAHCVMAQELNEMAVACNMPKPYPGLIEPVYPDEQQPAPPAPPPPAPDWQQLGDIVLSNGERIGVCVEDADRSAHPSHY